LGACQAHKGENAMATDKIIEVEADTLEEARRMVKSQMPEGFKLLSEQIISDGIPKTKIVQSIEIEADSFDDARDQLKSRIPTNLELISEHILSDGKPVTVRSSADTVDDAYVKAQSRIPANAEVVEKKVITAPERITITIDAFTEQDAWSSARFEARTQFGSSEKGEARNVRLTVAGSKGFLGIGKKPNHYGAEIFLPAYVEITYRTRAKVVFDIGEVQKVKAKVSAKTGMIPQDKREQTRRDGIYYCQACGEKKASRMSWGWFCSEGCQDLYGRRLYRGGGDKYCQWCGSQLKLTAQSCYQCGESQKNYRP
jgi:hypothetical protein